jgi:hypothetical protein
MAAHFSNAIKDRRKTGTPANGSNSLLNPITSKFLNATELPEAVIAVPAYPVPLSTGNVIPFL